MCVCVYIYIKLSLLSTKEWVGLLPLLSFGLLSPYREGVTSLCITLKRPLLLFPRLRQQQLAELSNIPFSTQYRPSSCPQRLVAGLSDRPRQPMGPPSFPLFQSSGTVWTLKATWQVPPWWFSPLRLWRELTFYHGSTTPESGKWKSQTAAKWTVSGPQTQWN